MNRRFIQIAFATSAIVFFGRLWHLVWTNVVNVPFLDQWDVLRPFFAGDGLWVAFRYQHGPHRQGLGSFVIALSNGLSGWNMNVLSLVTTCVLFVAFLVAVRLRVLLYGPLCFWDLLIPVFFFRLSQYESVIFAANPAHGAIPLVLIFLTCLTLASDRRLLQLIAIPALAFFSAHTGFAVLLVPVLAGVLVVRGIGEWRARRSADLRFTVATSVSVVLLSSTFLLGYHASEHFVLPCPDGASSSVLTWIGWPIVMVSRSFGVSGTNGFWLAIGAVLFVLPGLVAVGAGLTRGWSVTMRTGTAKEWAAQIAPVVLIGYSLVFSGASAPARICGGLSLARESRYVTHMIPFALGLYFAYLLLARMEFVGSSAKAPRPDCSRNVGLGVRFVGVIFAAFVLFSSSGLTSFDRFWIEENHNGKARFARCVADGGDAVQCEAYARYTIFTVAKDLDERIEFLRSRRLSLFADDR